MFETRNSRLHHSTAVCALIAGFCVAGQPAHALGADQSAAVAATTSATGKTTAADSADVAIIVTGSRIGRRGVESSSPIQTIDSKALDSRGFSTVAQALNELPAFGIPGASPVGFGQSNFGAGQSFVNFLGLGSQRTLTLVNGRRFVSANTGSVFGPTGSGGSQVDLNTIPTKMIDRIETVAAIGAPIYGSDAIAGTINIILKKNFEGVNLDAQTGISSRGDSEQYRVRALVGKNFADGRGNITVSGEYSNSKGLLFTARRVTATDNRFDNAATPGKFAQVPYTDFRVPSISTSGIPLVGGAANGLDFPLSPQQSNVFFGDSTVNFGVNGPGNSQLRFDPSGKLIPIDFGQTIGSPDGFNVFTSGGNGFRLTDVENLLTDLKRYNVTATLAYELTDDIRLFGEGWYSISEGRNLASQPAYNSALFGAAGTRDGNVIIPISNPFLNPDARNSIVASINANPNSDQNQGLLPQGATKQDYFYIGRANYDLSPGVSTGKVQILRFVGGVEGTLHVLKGKDWHAEASFTYGSSLTTSRNPELNQQNFLNAVNAVTDTSGHIICAPGFTNSAAPTLATTCSPLNLFGNMISRAARDYVTSIATPRNLNTQADAVVAVSGPLATLPGGDIDFALGYEHRVETSSFSPGSFYFGSGTGGSDTRDSFGRGTPIDPVYGKFHTNEIFGELNADIISPANDVRFVHALLVNSAARYIWNSLAGNDLTWTAGARYAPTDFIAFRGAFTRAVRAPSVTEAFNPKSVGYFFAVDPCDQAQIGNGPDPATRAKNCASAGVPAGFNSLSNQRSFLGYTFGNPSLTNEKSNSYTLGLVFTPKAIPGFSATVDYVNIKLNSAITQFSPTGVVTACYDAPNYPANPFCGLFERDGARQLTNIGTTYFNSAELRYKGILADIKYRTETPFLGEESHIGVSLSYQYLDTLTTQVSAGSVPRVDDNSVGYSRHKGIMTFNYDDRSFDYQVQVQYIGSANVDNNVAPNFYSIQRYDPVAFVNMAVTFDVTPNFTVRASVDNVFDTKPPFPYPLNGSSNPNSNPQATYFTGILGRFIRVGAGVHF